MKKAPVKKITGKQRRVRAAIVFSGLILALVLVTSSSVAAAVHTGQHKKLKALLSHNIERARGALVDHYVKELEQKRRIENDQENLINELIENTYELEVSTPEVTVINRNNGTTQKQTVKVTYQNNRSVNLDEIQRQNEEYVRKMSEQSKLNLENFRTQSQQSMQEFEQAGQQGLEDFRNTQEAEQQKRMEEFKQKYDIK